MRSPTPQMRSPGGLLGRVAVWVQRESPRALVIAPSERARRPFFDAPPAARRGAGFCPSTASVSTFAVDAAVLGLPDV